MEYSVYMHWWVYLTKKRYINRICLEIMTEYESVMGNCSSRFLNPSRLSGIQSVVCYLLCCCM